MQGAAVYRRRQRWPAAARKRSRRRRLRRTMRASRARRWPGRDSGGCEGAAASCHRETNGWLRCYRDALLLACAQRHRSFASVASPHGPANACDMSALRDSPPHTRNGGRNAFQRRESVPAPLPCVRAYHDAEMARAMRPVRTTDLGAGGWLGPRRPRSACRPKKVDGVPIKAVRFAAIGRQPTRDASTTPRPRVRRR